MAFKSLALPVMFAVWLHGYYDGARQSALNCASLPNHGGNQQRLWLPKPDWFASCLEANKVGNPAHRWQGSDAASRPTIQALALVKAGKVWDSVLTPLNDEELLGFEFFGYPTDFYSLQVQAIMTAKEPFILSETKTYKYVRGQDGVARQRGDDFNVNSSVLTLPFHPYALGMDMGSVQLRRPDGSQITVASALLEWRLDMSDMSKHCMVVPILQPLLDLICKGVWRTVPCLGRWLNLLSQLPERVQSRVGDSGSDPPQPQQGQISRGKVLHLIRQLQAWCVQISEQTDEQREEFQGAVAWLRNVMSALPGDHESNWVRSKNAYTSLFLVKSMLMTRLLPAYVSSKQLCIDAVLALFPNLLAEPVAEILKQKHVFPSKGSKHAMRLILDVSLMLWRGRREECCEFVRFGGADSSPQLGSNWLLSSCFYIEKNKLIDVFHSVQRMILDCHKRTELKDFWEQDDVSMADHKVLCMGLRKEHHIPVAMGNAAESTGNKCAALLHKWALCVRSMSALGKYRDSFMSFCSDMGTELGIGEFRVDSVESLMPSWLLPPNLQSDLESGHIEPIQDTDADMVSDMALPAQLVHMPEPEPAPAPVQGFDTAHPDHAVFFLRNAVVIPGALHIVNNALQQVSTSMTYWDTWFEQLQMFEGLWQCGRLQRFVNYCVRPSQVSHKADELLRQKLGTLYMKRWGEIAKFCQRLSNVLWIIRCAWNERLFLQGVASQTGQDGQAHFNPEKFTNILQDNLFFCYFDLVLNLTKVLEACGQWAESCPCHEDLQWLQLMQTFELHSKRSNRSVTVPSLFGKLADTCPMRGKRLPELVAGGMKTVLEHLAGMAFGDLLQKHCHLLAADQWTLVVQDFEKAKAHALLEFQIKFDWSQRLPWKLALLGHSDLGLARRELSSVVSQFDSQSSALQKHHHRLTLQLLGKCSSVRADLDRFLMGEALEELPQLEHFAACFRFMQITERSYEAAHSIVKRRAPPNSKGPTISLTLRLLDLACDVKLEPHILMEVAAEFENARGVKAIPQLLGISTHPELAALQPMKRNRWKLIQKLNHVLYRNDPFGQFPDVSHVDHQHKMSKEKAKKAGEKLCQATEARALTYSSLRADALFKHFLSLAGNCPGLVFSLPQDVVNSQKDAPTLVALQDALTMTAPAQSDALMFSDMAVSNNDQPPAGQGQGLVEAPGNSPPGSKTLFIKVVSVSPSSRKTMTLSPAAAGISGRLKDSDIAVTVHDSEVFGPGTSSWICVTPSVRDSSLSLQILSRFPQSLSYEDMSRCFCLHLPASSNKLLYTIPDAAKVGVSRQGLARIVSDLVLSTALPGYREQVALKPSTELSALQAGGFIHKSSAGDGFQLSQEGLEKLQMCQQYDSMKPVAKVTHHSLSLPGPSEHELLQALEEAGWSWERLPRKRSADAESVAKYMYEVGKAKIWRTSSFTLHIEYLQCLLTAEDLKNKYGIVRIPHGASAATYVSLLKGTVTEPQPHPRQVLLLEDDMEINENSAAAHRVPLGDIDEGNNGNIDDAVGETERFLMDYFDADIESLATGRSPVAAAALEAQASNATPANESEPVQPIESDTVGDGSGAPPVSSPLVGKQPAASNIVPEAKQPASKTRAEPHAPKAPTLSMAAFKFGAFHFTKKTSKNKSVSWEATCPFHRRNEKTGCKHAKVVNPLTEDQSALVILQLKHWCNAALSFSRQREHLAFSFSADTVPPEALVEAACIPKSRVVSDVKTDVELDGAAGPPAAAIAPKAAAAKAANKASAPKAKPKVKEKAKARGKAAPKANTKVSNDSGHSSSSTSSSESDSDKESGSSSDSSSSSSSSSWISPQLLQTMRCYGGFKIGHESAILFCCGWKDAALPISKGTLII